MHLHFKVFFVSKIMQIRKEFANFANEQRWRLSLKFLVASRSTTVQLCFTFSVKGQTVTPQLRAPPGMQASTGTRKDDTDYKGT